MRSIVVLGGTGMLGSMVVRELAADDGLQVVASARDDAPAGALAEGIAWRPFEVRPGCEETLRQVLEGAAWVVNAIGITKPYVKDHISAEVVRAVRVNAEFPHLLARAAADVGARVLQIATDCVYTGQAGALLESAPHDAHDVYGKTKSLGEVRAPGFHNLRCSIVGPEPRANVFLLEWLRRQPAGAEVFGFTNHLWNGVTTLHFARLCRGIIRADVDLPELHHVVPRGRVTKLELLECFARALGRSDLSITPKAAPVAVDRTLACADEGLNRRLWAAASYDEPPSVPEMVDELARAMAGA